jgi:oxygen-independent coproporphyrinogen-3 oxidase
MSEQLIDWDLALIQKYNYSGPRYTSYPTALEFSEDYGTEAFLKAVARYPERPLAVRSHPVLPQAVLFLWLQQDRDSPAA